MGPALSSSAKLERDMTPNSALTELRNAAPLVHNITNYVAMNISANVALAAGASPAMIHAVEEVDDFTPIAGAMTINIGTLSEPWVEAMLKAADAANASDTPWVLDPVAHFATPYRAKAAQDLVSKKPAIIRGNASEILALAGEETAGKGADSGDSVASAEASAIAFAQRTDAVVAITGEVDFVTDGIRSARIKGGDAIMPKITALGCSLTVLMGGYAAVAPAFDATTAALLHFAQAGSEAAKAANGPGSFSVSFLDALHSIQSLDETQIEWL